MFTRSAEKEFISTYDIYINVSLYINLFFNLHILSNIFMIRKYTVKCESERIMFQIHRWKSHYREHKEENGGMKMRSLLF